MDPFISTNALYSCVLICVCVFITYLCCLCDPVAVAEHWALGTLLLPLCRGHGHLGKCGCAGSGSNSCVCCWWPRCPRGLTGEPAARHWIDYPAPERKETHFQFMQVQFIWYIYLKLMQFTPTVLQWILPSWRFKYPVFVGIFVFGVCW